MAHQDVAVQTNLERIEPIKHIEPESASLFAQAARAIEILDGHSSGAGDEVLKVFAAHLGALFDADIVGVTEVVEGHGRQSLRVRAEWASDEALKFAPVYDASGSPCERVIVDGEYGCPTGLPAAFPDDPWLEQHGFESFFGAAFSGPDGNACGHLCVLSRRTCRKPEETLGVVQMCASAIGRELQRRRVEGVLTTQRSILELVARGAALGDVLDALCVAVERLISSSVCSLMMREDAVLRLVSGPSMPQELAMHFDGISVDGCNCGAAISRGCPVITPDTSIDPLWEAMQDFAQRHSIKACWSFPVIATTGGVIGSFAVSRSQTGLPSRDDTTLMATAAHLACIAIERDEHVRRQDMMMRELDHRVKNNLAAVMSLCESSLDSSQSKQEFGGNFIGRLRSLAHTHEALAREHWSGIELAEALRIVTAPYQAERIHMSGDPIRLAARAANPLGLALHELVTNAAKHGALGEKGVINVSWHRTLDAAVELIWEERGGPPVPASPQEGYGLRLVRGLINHEIGGDVSFEFRPTGFACTLHLPTTSEAKSQPAEETPS